MAAHEESVHSHGDGLTDGAVVADGSLLRVWRLQAGIGRNDEAGIGSRRLGKLVAGRSPRGDRARKPLNERAHSVRRPIDPVADLRVGQDLIVVEDTPRSVDGRAAVPGEIIGNSQPWAPIVGVLWNLVCVRAASRQPDRIRRVVHELPLITQTGLDYQLLGHAPVVLSEHRDVRVVVRGARCSVSLHVGGGQSGGERLQRRDWRDTKGGNSVRKGDEDEAAAEMEGKGRERRVHVIEIESRLQRMRAVVVAEGVLQLVALIVSRLGRETLTADAGHPGDLNGGTALQIVIAWPAAVRIERVDRLILAGILSAQLIDPTLAQHVRLGGGQRPVLPILNCTATPREVIPPKGSIFSFSRLA